MTVFISEIKTPTACNLSPIRCKVGRLIFPTLLSVEDLQNYSAELLLIEKYTTQGDIAIKPEPPLGLFNIDLSRSLIQNPRENGKPKYHVWIEQDKENDFDENGNLQLRIKHSIQIN